MQGGTVLPATFGDHLREINTSVILLRRRDAGMTDGAGQAQRRRGGVPVLEAQIRDVRLIASLLRPIAFTKICQVLVSYAGIQVITELNGVIQATAYIGRAMFDRFTFTPPEENTGNGFDDTDISDEEDAPVAILDVSLERWLMCLSIYGMASGPSAMASSRSFRGGGDGGFISNPARDAEFARRLPFSRSKTSVEMVYVGKGSPLSLIVTQGDVVSKCELATFETQTLIISDMPYVAERTVGQIIMQSKELTEALMSIDASSREVTISFIDGTSRPDLTLSATQPPRTPSRRRGGGGVGPLSSTLMMGDEEPVQRDLREGDMLDTRTAAADHQSTSMMRISARGDTGSSELDFPNKSKIFESFSIRFASQHAYSYANIQHCLRALQMSLKTSIRIDDQGMMSMQCLFPERPMGDADGPAQTGEEVAEAESRGFVEIRMLPAVTDEDL